MFEKLMSLQALSSTRIWLYDHHPFHSKTDWYTFLTKMTTKITDNDTSERAAAVSFSLILAVFPTIIFLFTLIPYVPLANLQARIMSFLGRVLPGDTFRSVETTMLDIISRPRSGILSLGFLLALYSATSGLVALMNAFATSHESEDKRGFLTIRAVAVGLTFTLALALLLAIVVLLIGGVVSSYLLRIGILNNPLFVTLLSLARYGVVFGVFVGAVSVIYRYGPGVAMNWKLVSPGAVLASGLIVLTTLGFSYYVSNFGSYNKLYGSIGTLIALMIWINLISLLLILGFDMNVALYNLEGGKTPNPNAKTTATSREP
ncbi:YihY/virulence factor BrkB family protein [Spirosoma pollinicola]|uniref:YihY/virulence factor BrkB family protein n=1 Tax=Spirosoma pollinicola TaxID=2057025 RepID=A0A2K8ZA48_9BACT|nr:YihY/virulence factor BrkB family protein [Spirosoma pollinicola]AUD06747.1 YihY/virulence factor BrkB family protein [Spirosoma pollinicola]